jgi:hypothetical protein
MQIDHRCAEKQPLRHRLARIIARIYYAFPAVRSISSEVSAVKTAITANMSPRFDTAADIGVTVDVFGFAAPVHRY